ncbi:MAG: MG2 domain-containing protein [Nitrososphaerota archaeon]
MKSGVLAGLLACLMGLGWASWTVLAQEEPVDTIYVFTDRGVYRQGMIVAVNVLVRDAEGIPLGGVGVYVSMTDPLDQVVFERVGSTSPNGSYVTYAVLGGDFSEGYYRIDAVALVDIVPTPSSTVHILVCRLCVDYDNVTSRMPEVVTVTETEYIPLTTTDTVTVTSSLAATTLTETSTAYATSVVTRSVTLTATLEVNPYLYIPGLAVLAFAGYTVTLLVLRRGHGKAS